MPLIKSGSRKAVGTNVKEMESSGRDRAQSVAAALSNARRYGAHMASGGAASPMGEKMAARHLFHEGFLHSTVPGRTDKLPIAVSGGAYVLPADHVAALGQGNSLAGADIVNKMFRMGQDRSPSARSVGAHLNLRPTAAKFARGGHGKHIPIIAAGGEIVIPPDKIIARFGDLKNGHAALDKWVIETRKKHVKTLRGLKPPKKD